MEGLQQRGVLVRGGGALGRAGALRVTYGTPEENARFLEALAEVLVEGATTLHVMIDRARTRISIASHIPRACHVVVFYR